MSFSTAPEIIEGTWEEIARMAGKLAGHRLRVTILPDVSEPPRKSSAENMLQQGMFPQLTQIDQEDFKAAEFHLYGSGHGLD